ncbi:MAG: polyribonucleotide nucleotidyltransferase [Clostridiales Family XIII bacterium]|nr:polyribonucleotide nucleotidyltransferase [Clostridiales Family XIII bacterium]
MRFTDYRTYKTAMGGRLLQFEIGKLAEQASGAVTVRYGDTVVNVTATMAKEPRESQDFFPLSCDYEEKMYAAGKIPGGFIKREGRPSEKATLTSRLMDRPLRPLFPAGFFNEVTVNALVLSVDPDCSPEVAALIGSSVALTISDIPFDGPTAAVVVGYIDGRYITNPTQAQREESDLYLTVAGTEKAVMMVESGANELSEDVVLGAIIHAHDEIKKIASFISNDILASETQLGFVKPKVAIPEVGVPESIFKVVENKVIDLSSLGVIDSQSGQTITGEFTAREWIDKILHHFDKVFPKHQDDKISFTRKLLQAELTESLAEAEELSEGAVKKYIAETVEIILVDEFRKMVIEDDVRPDGRRTDEVRDVWAETSFLPRAHGSGLFKRGQTQVLSIAALAPLREKQNIDGIGDETEKRYMHHYNFPSYSVGETRPSRSPGRREIGHGALAERALIPVLPSEEEFPYAIRVVSEVLSSNGSSSQGSVCGSSLALMDAGVPIKAAVSGIAMGLIKEEELVTTSSGRVVAQEKADGRIKILSDIAGLEDHYGNMDFKVAGTKDGVTAVQMDIKCDGITKEVLGSALEQAKEGREHIRNIMNEEITEPRTALSQYAPRIESIQIDPDDIGTIVGKGGKTINGIIAETGVKIDINDEGLISIAAIEPDGMDKAISMIELLLKEVEVGEVYDGKVTGIKDFGAFVEILPGKEGLLHISEIENHRVNKVEDVLNMGDEVKVIVKGIDDRGKISLSRKALL